MDDHYDPLANSVQLSTTFVYPQDEPTAEEVADKIVAERLGEMLNRLAIYVIPTKDPRLTLIALFYSAGVDLSFILNCDNSESAIAKRLGIPKQTMSLAVKKIREQFGLIHSSTNNMGMTPEAYENNFRKPKI